MAYTLLTTRSAEYNLKAHDVIKRCRKFSNDFGLFKLVYFFLSPTVERIL